MGFERPDQKNREDHEQHERGKRSTGNRTERNDIPGPEEYINMHSSVNGEDRKNEEDHVPKLPPRPLAIFTSSLSGSTSLRLLIALASGTEVMTGGWNETISPNFFCAMSSTA